jgi:hypothetical protein
MSRPRKEGGQPGNKNALKHGFYSHSFTRREKESLNQDIMGELNDEDKLLNIVINRLFTSMKHEKMNFDKYCVGLRTISLAIGRKAALHHSRKEIYSKLTTIEKALEELKDIPPEED